MLKYPYKGKKKLPGKRITGFEISPRDPSKEVVTSANSLVRVLTGMDVMYKFKASSIGVGANQMCALFTSDGKYIVSTSEDSNVYIWNCNSQEKSPSKKNIHSCESFTLTVEASGTQQEVNESQANVRAETKHSEKVNETSQAEANVVHDMERSYA